MVTNRLIATKYKGPRITLGPFLSQILSKAINDVTREEDGETLDSFALTAGIFFRIIQYYHLRVEEEFDETKTNARLGCDTAFDR
jgi:hypothetical protein